MKNIEQKETMILPESLISLTRFPKVAVEEGNLEDLEHLPDLGNHTPEVTGDVYKNQE